MKPTLQYDPALREETTKSLARRGLRKHVNQQGVHSLRRLKPFRSTGIQIKTEKVTRECYKVKAIKALICLGRANASTWAMTATCITGKLVALGGQYSKARWGIIQDILKRCGENLHEINKKAERVLKGPGSNESRIEKFGDR